MLQELKLLFKSMRRCLIRSFDNNMSVQSFGDMDTLVSVIVPVYNAEMFLPRCIDSILEQSYQNFELILINDGSIDGSGLVCDSYASIDVRIKVCHQNNAGPSVARNVGIDNSIGKYLMFVDADDFVDQDIILALLNVLETDDAGLSICTYRSRIFNDKMEQTASSFEIEQEIVSVERLLGLKSTQSVRSRTYIIGSIWGRLYRSAVINASNLRFNTNLTRYEDVLFNVSYLSCISRIHLLNRSLYNYCVHCTHLSLSDTIPINKTTMLTTSYTVISDLYADNDFSAVKYYYAHILVGHIIRLFQASSPFTFVEAYREVRSVGFSTAFRDSMRYYHRPYGGSVLIPILLKIRLYLFASVVAKYRMQKAAYSNKPIRQWCFSPSPK
jgi:glycosyltransferase involved in cell wall biosynthesis